MADLALRLREARTRAGFLNKSAFARKISVERSAIDRLERGDVKPSADTLTNWARECGVSADWLLGLTSATACQPDAAVKSAGAST